MHKQKIILITNEYPPKRGGAGVYCEEIVYNSQKLGIPLQVWVPDYVKENQIAYQTEKFEWVQWKSIFIKDPEQNVLELVCYDETI